jgi:hypothetical protein
MARWRGYRYRGYRTGYVDAYFKLLGLAFAFVFFVIKTLFKLVHSLVRYWRGRRVTSNGYVRIKSAYEHRQIAVDVLGRTLDVGEVIHHINGGRADNRIANLCVLPEENHENFHAWLQWKKETNGRYPSIKHQRSVLEDRYSGILLDSCD